MSWYDKILRPIMIPVSYILYGIHWFLNLFIKNNSASWVLSIIMLTVIIRAALIPLFVKQIKSSRSMQTLQPEIKRIQNKYKGKKDAVSRQRQQQELMEVYRKNGANPLSSCLPILIQSPFFFALYRVLYAMPMIANGRFGNGTGMYPYKTIGPLNQTVASSLEHSVFFGAPLPSTLMHPTQYLEGAQLAEATSHKTQIYVVIVILIIAMVATTFITQHQLTMKNMPKEAMEGNPMARQQKMMLYAMPFIYIFTGPAFPVGVLIYWLTTNVWSFGQQYIVIKRMPTPGSEAEARMNERKALKSKKEDIVDVPLVEESEPAKPVNRQRQQPVSKNRAKKQGGRPIPKAGATASSVNEADDADGPKGTDDPDNK